VKKLLLAQKYNFDKNTHTPKNIFVNLKYTDGARHSSARQCNLSAAYKKAFNRPLNGQFNCRTLQGVRLVTITNEKITNVQAL
jgi:hypothetical protein